MAKGKWIFGSKVKPPDGRLKVIQPYLIGQALKGLAFNENVNQADTRSFKRKLHQDPEGK